MLYQVIHLKDHFPFLGENGKDPTLTVYAADNMHEMKWDDKKHPSALICPGGSYVYTSFREAEPIALNLLPMGYNAFVLDYSCAPHCFPTQLIEVAAALELMHANADIWHVDTQRIAIMGFSAGGHLAGHYSNCYDIPEVRAVFPDSKPVHASVLGYPVISALPQYRHEHSIQCVSGHETITDEDVEKFSLENRVSEKTPPAFIWHTAEDDCVPVMNSILYAQALAKQNIRFAMHIYPFGYHGLSTADGVSCWPLDEDQSAVHQWLGDLKHWLKSTLGEE
jgi:acetyl esterase/lipase